MATPLNIDIFGREEEVETILKSLDENQIILISGLPGVGKTRLALEALKRYKEQNDEYNIKCLRNNGQNIYDDLNLYFNESGSYLLLVDDANLLTNIQLILDLFGWESKGIKIKLLLTVREYAEEKIKEKISKYSFTPINIKALKADYIKLLCKYLGVLNFKYLDRIEEIARGNPRLAIMGCTIAKRENKLDSLKNVSDIVESYYREVKSNFEADLQNEELLKVGTLLSFLNHVNLKDEENIEMLCDVLALERQTFLNQIFKLHSMEIVDIYENELVKISDQILSLYLFYLSVFKKRDISYKTLLDRFYPSLKGRIVENLNSVFSYFYKEEHLNLVKSGIKEFYEERKNNFKESELEDFLITFWFALEIEGLIYAKEKIDSLENNTPIELINYEIENNNTFNNIIKLLACYRNSKYYMEAIDLILLYFERNPIEFSSIYKVLTQYYGFEKDSDIYGYVMEFQLLKKIGNMYDIKKDLPSTNLLIRLIEYFLKFSYEQTILKNNREFSMYRFPVYLKGELPQIRKEIWTRLTEIYNQKIYSNDIHKVLYNLGKNNIREFDEEVLKFDKEFIESIIYSIKEVTLEQSIVFNRLKRFFNRNQIYFNEVVDKKIKTKEFYIYNKIFSEPKYNKEDRFAEEKELIDWGKTLTNEDFKKMFLICKQSMSIDYLNLNGYGAGKKIETLLVSISLDERMKVLNLFFDENLKVNLYSKNIIKSMDDLCYVEQSIKNKEFYYKDYWLYCIYEEMSLINPNKDLLNRIYDYFNKLEGAEGYTRNITFLKSFLYLDENVFINVINLLLEKNDNIILSNLESFLLYCGEDEEYVTVYLKNDYDLLKTLYVKFLSLKNYFDYDSSILKVITRRSPQIFKEILESIILDEKTTYEFNNEIDLLFIWNEENWEELVNLVSDIFERFVKNQQKYYVAKSLLEKLLLLDENVNKDNLNNWLESKIPLWIDDEELIFCLYECLTKFEVTEQIEWIVKLIHLRKDIEFFKRIPFFPNAYTWSGSEVPYLRQRQQFFQQISNKLEGIQFLEHKQWLQEKIDEKEKQIKEVKIKELTEDL